MTQTASTSPEEPDNDVAKDLAPQREDLDLLVAGSPAPAHHHGLTQGSFVDTDKVDKVKRKLRLALRSRNAVFWGPPGLGKTCAVRMGLQAMQIDFRELRFSDNAPLRGEVADELHRALTGRPGHGAIRDVERSLKQHFRTHASVLVVEETEALGAKRLSLLRVLQEDEGSKTTVVYLGSEEAVEILREDPRMDDRLSAGVEFRPMTPTAFARYLRQYHPLYAGMTDEQLLEAATLLKGSWRQAAKTAMHAEFICEDDQRDLSGGGLTLFRHAHHSAWEPSWDHPGGERQRQAGSRPDKRRRRR